MSLYEIGRIGDLLRVEAQPVLEALANNEDLRDRALRRFDRDDPPPYESSTEPEEPNEEAIFPRPRGVDMYLDDDSDLEGLPQSVLDIMEDPLTDAEIAATARRAGNLLNPRLNYLGDSETEFRRQYREVYTYRGHMRLRRLRRYGVVTRHLVKSRWEKLGLWNPEWGFPGRNLQPSDRIDDWRWPWERQDADGEVIIKKRHDAILRALRLRQNLHRGEWVPSPPRSHLGPDASAAEAESFLISRPWFIFRLELEEEYTRLCRVPKPDTRYWETIKWEHKQRWEQYQEYRHVVGEEPCHWKWRHESPSPEPEHLPPVLPMGLPPPSPDISYSPSEVDELETIDLPRAKQPDGYWTQEDSTTMVGQCKNLAVYSRTPSPTPPPPSPRTRLARLGPMPLRDNGFGSLQSWWAEKQAIEDALRAEQEAHAEQLGQDEYMRGDLEPEPQDDDPIEGLSGLQRADHGGKDGSGDRAGVPATASAAAPSRRPRLNPRDRSQRAATTPTPETPRPLAPRRSGRVASLKRQAETLSQDARPNKRTRLVREAAGPPMDRAGTKTALPKSSPGFTLPKEDEDAAEPRRGRGRPKKQSVADELPGKGHEVGDTPKRGRGRPKKPSGKVELSAAATPKRGRGRPKKEPGAAKTPVLRKAAAATVTPKQGRRGRPRKSFGVEENPARQPASGNGGDVSTAASDRKKTRRSAPASLGAHPLNPMPQSVPTSQPPPTTGEAARALDGTPKRGRGRPKKPSLDKPASVQQQLPDNRRGIRKVALAASKGVSAATNPPAASPVAGLRRGRSQRKT